MIAEMLKEMGMNANTDKLDQLVLKVYSSKLFCWIIYYKYEFLQKHGASKATNATVDRMAEQQVCFTYLNFKVFALFTNSVSRKDFVDSYFQSWWNYLINHFRPSCNFKFTLKGLSMKNLKGNHQVRISQFLSFFGTPSNIYSYFLFLISVQSYYFCWLFFIFGHE